MISKPLADDAFHIDFTSKHSKTLKHHERQLSKLKEFTDKYFKDAKYIDNRKHHAVQVPRGKYQSWFNATLYKLYRNPALSRQQIRTDLNAIRPTMQKTCARLYVQWIGFLRLVVREFRVELLAKEEVIDILYGGWNEEEKEILQEYHKRCQNGNATNAYREMAILWKVTVAFIDKIIVSYEKIGVQLDRGDLLEMARTTEVKPIWTNGNNNFKMVGSKADKPFQNYQEANGYRGTKEFVRYEVTWDEEKDIDTSTISMERPTMENKPPIVLPLPPPPIQEDDEPIMMMYEHRKSSLIKLFNHCFPRVNIHAFFLDMNNEMCEQGCQAFLSDIGFENYGAVIDFLGLNDEMIDTTRSQNFRDLFETIKDERTFYQLILYMCYQLSQENDDDTQSDVSMTDVQELQSDEDQQLTIEESSFSTEDSPNFNGSNAIVDHSNLPLSPSFPDGMDWKMSEPQNIGSPFPTTNTQQWLMYQNHDIRIEDQWNWRSRSGSTHFEDTTSGSSVFSQSEQFVEQPGWGEPHFGTFRNYLAGGRDAYVYCGDLGMTSGQVSDVKYTSVFQETRQVDPPPRNPHEQGCVKPPYPH